MAQIIGLPKLSPTMEEGVLVKWVKREGDKVSPGDLVAEVETDKANMDFSLEDEGVLLKLLVAEGETVKLGAPVAILGSAGEDIRALEAEARGRGAARPVAGATPPAPPPATASATGSSQPGPAPAPRAAPAAPPAPRAQPAQPPQPARAGGTLLASPLAKTLAIELGIDIRAVKGSGPGGRIVEADVRAAAEAQPADEPAHGPGTAPPAAQSPAASEPPRETGFNLGGSTALAVVNRVRDLAVPGGPEDYADKPLSSMRKTIARRLTESKQTVPHFYLTTSLDAEPMLAFRQALNRLVPKDNKVSVNDMVVKGVALALRRVPECNASFTGDAIRYYSRVHLGVAIAIDDGLVTPVVRDADLKGLGVISAEIKDLAQRARSRRLKQHEIQGSTFSVSNLGMFGIDHFEAVINPPEGGILAVGTIRDVPVVDGAQIRIGKRMKLTMSCDHRVIDGALGARFLDELTHLLERPEMLAL
jgi:pyruvate dehydrogenase E2 component (dihydrolipoamide acetyltransferase)